jgi:hypothetical protein
METPSRRTLSATPEGGLQVVILAVAPKSEPQATEQLLLIASQGIEVLEQGSIQRNALPTLAHHAEADKCTNSIWVQVNKLAT